AGNEFSRPHLTHPRHQGEDRLILGDLVHLTQQAGQFLARDESSLQERRASFGHRPLQESLAFTTSHDRLVEGDLRPGELGGEDQREEAAAERVVETPSRAQAAPEIGEGVERRRWLAARRRQVTVFADEDSIRPEQAMHFPQSLLGRGEVKQEKATIDEVERPAW